VEIRSAISQIYMLSMNFPFQAYILILSHT
jgi:hypothetical protein